MIRLCFDYGHGGKDSGASYMGRKESQDVLSMGQEVAKYVRQHGIIVDETRVEDVAVSLGARCRFENRTKYDYFISFHRNAYKPEVAQGAETYIFSNGGAKAYALAKSIQSALVGLGFRNRGVKRANFHVLRGTKAPAVLIEIGFIDYTGDNQLFVSKQEEIARALAGAIVGTATRDSKVLR